MFKPCLLACCCVLPSFTAELALKDLSFAIDLTSAEFDFDIQGENRSATGTDSFDASYAIRIGSLWSFAPTGRSHGWIAGAELLWQNYEFPSAGTLDVYGIRVQGGYGLAFSDKLQLLVAPYIGYGLAQLDLPATSGYDATSGDGNTIEYGLRADLHYAFSERFTLVCGLGYGLSSTDVTADDVDITIDHDGLSLGVGLTWRWDVTPPPLD